jgi:hypothetical protein
VLIAYTLLRRWMREMAVHAKVDHQRISFHTVSYAIVNLLALPSLDSAGTLPKQLVALLVQSRHFMLPPRRTERSFHRFIPNFAHPVRTLYLACTQRRCTAARPSTLEAGPLATGLEQ